MRLIDFSGRMATSETSIHDRTNTIIGHIFFTHDVAKFEPLIEWTRLNANDSHPSVSFEPLIEDKEQNPMVTPKSTYK